MAQKLVAKIVDFRLTKENVFETMEKSQHLTIEFYCDNPANPMTIPNRLLEKLEKELQVCILFFEFA